MNFHERRRDLEFAQQQHEFCNLLANAIIEGNLHPDHAGRCARLLASIKRGNSKATPVVIQKMLRSLPLRCHCGARAVYRVKMTGFCSKHRGLAVAQNKQFYKLQEQRSAGIDAERDLVERFLRERDHQRKLHRSQVVLRG